MSIANWAIKCAICDRVDTNALNQAQNSQDALAAQAVIWDAIMQEKRFTR